jgi:DNA-binding response OmpR family regulator
VNGCVLIVEDDERIRRATRLALGVEGYDVVEAESGEAALVALGRGGVDLVVVDLMLPGMSGFELCHAIRDSSALPVVVVTARTDTHDVVAALEAGADDYVTKPFSIAELAARLRALLRRVHRVAAPRVRRFGHVVVDPEAASVWRDGKEVPLTKTEFLLLRELTDNVGIVLSRQDLLERVWGYSYLGDGRVVDTHIRRLRTKIERDPARPEVIRTVRGLGYRISRP